MAPKGLPPSNFGRKWPRHADEVHPAKIEVGDLIRVEVNPYNRYYGEPNEFTMLVTKIEQSENNRFMAGWSINGFEMETQKAKHLWYESERYQFFVVSKCDNQSKK